MSVKDDMIIQNRIDSVIEELENELGIVIMVDWWDYQETEDEGGD